MSKIKDSEKKESKEGFTTIDECVNKYFLDIEHSIPRFQQELFDLQNEYYKAWKNLTKASISLQKEFTSKIGIDDLSEPAQKILENMNEEIIRARSIRNQMFSAVIETMKKNIKMWNDNSELFEDWNRKTMQYWMSVFSLKLER